MIIFRAFTYFQFSPHNKNPDSSYYQGLENNSQQDYLQHFTSKLILLLEKTRFELSPSAGIYRKYYGN